MQTTAMLSTLLVALQLILVVLGQDYTGHKVYRVKPENKEQFQWVLELHESELNVKFWNEPRALGRSVDIQVSPEHGHSLRTAMRRLNIPHYVMIEDVQAKFDNTRELNEKARNARNPELKHDFLSYLNFDEILLWLQEMETDCAGRCTLMNIGQSYEGRPLPVLKITNGDGDDTKENLWLDSGIHAREWITPATSMYMVEKFVYSFGSDVDVDEILNTYNLYVQTVINPDGYVHSWDYDRMWRKTRRVNDGSSCMGADANRNYDFMWMTVGASSLPCQETFAGPTPFSEPETLAMSDFILSLGNIKMFLTLHSYGQLFMTPWGYTLELPPTFDELERTANFAVSAMYLTHGETYEVGAVSQILYLNSGTSRDWAHGVPQIEYVYTIELRDTGEHGFDLPPEYILPTAEETWEGYKALVRNMIPTANKA